ncbi:MAG: oxidoreductase [Phototrophicales bacterium]|jgi:protoporphyrinogen oxidase|nr:MAG: oxidoreductase [Phototrophicales bacterium]
MQKLSIGIIGAGATGIAAAWDLSRDGHDVTIYEAGAELGGLAAGFRDDHWAWSLEKFYHHWFETDTDIRALLTEMGLWDNVIFPRPKTSFWINGKIYRSEISPSALFLPQSPIATLRMGLFGVYLKLIKDGTFLEKFTAHDWMRHRMGEEAYGKFFKPLLIGKFGDQYQTVNMAWMWARVKARSLRLGIYKGGFQQALNDMGDKIRAYGTKIHLNSPVSAIDVQVRKPRLQVNGEWHTFDRVLSTTSPSLLLKLGGDALRNTDYGAQVANLKSIGSICVIFALKHSLLTDGTYWLNLPATSPDKAQSQFPFLALVEHTNWMDKAHYNGDVLIYCGDYVPADHEYFQMDESALIERFARVLPTFNNDFKPDWIRKAWAFRAPYAQPVPGINHSHNIPAIKTPLDGVYWASMSQVYPWDRGTNFAVEMGRRVARLMTEG